MTELVLKSMVYGMIAGNWANYDGGVALKYDSGLDPLSARPTLNNCTVAGNSAGYWAGGVYAEDRSGGVGCAINNTIIFFNYAPRIPEYMDSRGPGAVFRRSCVNGYAGVDRITNNPGFVAYGSGDFHLATNSPCINAGLNASASGTADLDGLARVSGGTIDIGAYEFQNPASTLSYAWLQQFGLPTDGSADNADSDKDGLNNWQEWISGTNPTNAASVLRLLPPVQGSSGVKVSWESVTNHTYFLERSTNLSASPAFRSLATNLVELSGTTTFTDTNVLLASPRFYRVGTQ